MTSGKWHCPYCHGVVRSGRRVSLDQAIDHHEETCPATPRPAK